MQPKPSTVEQPIDYRSYQRTKGREDKRHERKLAELKQRLLLFQATCPHPKDEVLFHPDPSGNNDSCHECRKCGKIDKHL